jgi:hypothetical protein
VIEYRHRLTDLPCDKSFVDVPFDVGAGFERIEVSYLFPTGAEGSVIDLGLAHRGRMRGWTGSEYGHVFIAEDRASAGYHAGPLEGPWHVVLGVVKRGPQAWVDLTIRLFPRTEAWLAGELHSHTEHSDGGAPVAFVAERAAAGGLDFLALTDHNTTAQNQLRPQDNGVLVIPGMELTSYWGHTNFLGLAEPVHDWRCRTPDDVPKKMAEAREAGATVVINHPFQNSAGGRWQGDFDQFDALEIWNGNWATHNEQALALWQEMLVAGRRVPATGGSDWHLKNRRRHGFPANRLRVQSRSIAGILAAVRAGTGVVASAPDETMAWPQPDSPSFGDTATHAGMRVTGLSPGDELRVIGADGVQAVHQARQAEMALDLTLTSAFQRLEVWRGAQPRLFTNPIWAD